MAQRSSPGPHLKGSGLRRLHDARGQRDGRREGLVVRREVEHPALVQTPLAQHGARTVEELDLRPRRAVVVAERHPVRVADVPARVRHAGRDDGVVLPDVAGVLRPDRREDGLAGGEAGHPDVVERDTVLGRRVPLDEHGTAHRFRPAGLGEPTVLVARRGRRSDGDHGHEGRDDCAGDTEEVSLGELQGSAPFF